LPNLDRHLPRISAHRPSLGEAARACQLSLLIARNEWVVNVSRVLEILCGGEGNVEQLAAEVSDDDAKISPWLRMSKDGPSD
jgi:hypothetical protein